MKLTITNFQKKYSGRLILSIPKAEFEPGIHWIKGENGSGKSTLFKCIAGLSPFEGTIAFDDGVSFSTKPRTYLSRVNYSEAEPLYPAFVTGLDVINFVANARDVDNESVQSLMKAFGVEPYATDICGTYSSGMLKKVCLVTGLLGSTHVLLLDEPFITLDAASREVLLTLLIEIQRKKDTIIFLSTHEWPTAEHLRLQGSYRIEHGTLTKDQ